MHIHICQTFFILFLKLQVTIFGDNSSISVLFSNLSKGIIIMGFFFII